MVEKTINKGNSTVRNDNEHRGSSKLLYQERWNIASTLDANDLTLEDIKRSIKIDDGPYNTKITKSVIDRIWFNTELYNSIFINASSTNGIAFKKADDLLQDNLDNRVVVYSVIPENAWFYSKIYSLSDLLVIKRCLENPNFVLVDAIRNLDFSDVKFWNMYNKDLYEWICKYIQSRKYEYIWKIRHKFFNERDNKELLSKAKWISEEYEKYNSIYWPCTFQEFIETISDKEWFKEWLDIMEWKKLKWVYCDMDGTLILDDKDWFVVNQKVLDYLEEQERLWNEVHIWTWWDINEQQQKLKRFWIKYPLISKYEHRWSEAEIVIDDQDYDSFTSDYWIKVQNYINVNDL